MSASRQSDAGAGPHVDSNGVVVVRFMGDVDEEAMHEAVVAIRRGAEATGTALLFCDFTGARSIGAAARRVDAVRDVRVEAVAIVGASFHMRVLTMLMTKAFQMLTKSTYPLRFFDTENEARAWLLEQRGARGGLGPVPPG